MQIFFFTLEEKWEEKRFVYVEVGLNLPGSVDVVVASQCRYGDTAVYDLLLTIVGSRMQRRCKRGWRKRGFHR